MSGVPEKWAEQARYDLETAHAMLESGRHLYVLFCCQQAVEKMLKGLIARRSGRFPPRFHNLKHLADIAQVRVSKRQAKFLRELGAYYIQSRYPEGLYIKPEQVDRGLADEILDKTENLLIWLNSMLK